MFDNEKIEETPQERLKQGLSEMNLMRNGLIPKENMCDVLSEIDKEIEDDL